VRVGFLGLGQIAGSAARALRAGRDSRWREARLAAWTPSGRGPDQAVHEGVIDVASRSPADAIDGADLVVLGAPLLDILDLIDQLAGPLRGALGPAAVITDVGSTKAAVIARAERHGLRFVGGHPMAGREQAGYAASDPELFADRPWIVVPTAAGEESDIRLVEGLALACAARPIRMTAIDHDAATAAISHLPLLLAAALVEGVAGGPTGERPGWATAAAIAAGGWRDTTRLALGDVTMGTGILATNPGPVAERLREVRSVLDGWLVELERPGGPDPTWIADRLRAAADRLGAAGSRRSEADERE
jgi:prephenate dehydrogenase